MRAATETLARLQPLRLGDSVPQELADRAGDVIAAAARLGAGLHPRVVESLRILCLALNTYASNRIEGHDTEPAEILRALGGQLSADSRRRALQEEARAHVATQMWLEERIAAGTLADPLDPSFIREVHRRFFEGSPYSFLVVQGNTGPVYCALPGATRGPGMDVVVGRHQPPSGVVVDRILEGLAAEYRYPARGTVTKLLDLAAAHHRLLYLHPFPEGNGRVVRLVTHAQVQLADIGAGGLWSISRGLGRGLADRGEYKRMLEHADSPRRGDLDGRGNLSLAALRDFIGWFLSVMLDQIRFMEGLYELGTLSTRLRRLAAERVPESPEGAQRIVQAALVEGEISRPHAWEVSGLSERRGRDIVRALLDRELLQSDSPRGLLRLQLAHPELFPRLF